VILNGRKGREWAGDRRSEVLSIPSHKMEGEMTLGGRLERTQSKGGGAEIFMKQGDRFIAAS